MPVVDRSLGGKADVKRRNGLGVGEGGERSGVGRAEG